MTERHICSASSVDYLSLAPETVRPLFDAAKMLAQSSLEPNLRVLIELRESQLNRCAFCLALHVREGKALGESDDRLFGVAAWRGSPCYSERERAATGCRTRVTYRFNR